MSDDSTAQEWPHVWWIPTGPLRRFPLHAVGSYVTDGLPATSVLDRVMSSYSLPIRSMIHSRLQDQAVTNPLPPTSPDKDSGRVQFPSFYSKSDYNKNLSLVWKLPVLDRNEVPVCLSRSRILENCP
ncbi:hypothetical protein GQ53DRAFT_768587 [Thozetella sp. PMI_491]|nr:hypothetical protein GQ53DRAFT_768587 [Thozetella sp. PMI_491]